MRIFIKNYLYVYIILFIKMCAYNIKKCFILHRESYLCNGISANVYYFRCIISEHNNSYDKRKNTNE